MGEAEKIRAILGKDELQSKLAARSIEQPESTMSTQLYQDKDTRQLFWRKQTNSFLGVRHEGLDPITFNQSLPKAKAKLQLITTIGQGRLPMILEERSSSSLDIISQYLGCIPLSPTEGTTDPQSQRHNSDKSVHLSKTQLIELRQVNQPVEAAASFKGVIQGLLPKLHLPTLQPIQSQLVDMEPTKARKFLGWFNLSTHNPLAFKQEIFHTNPT